MIEFEKKSRYTYDDFVEVVRLLRSPDGCPWDRVQTHDSIRRNFLEEVYECCEAIDTDDQTLMQEELGDVMMQVIFHAGIEEDRGRFNLEDVCDGAVKKLVFEEKRISFDQLGQALQNNWSGYENIRSDALRLPEKFGVNNKEADAIAAEFAHYCAGLVNNRPNGRGGVFKAAIYTIDHCLKTGARTMATPDGRLAGEPLSKNLCAVTGMDKKGVTALIHSAGKIDASLFPNGSVLDIVLHPSAVAGEEGLNAFYGILMTYFRKGGFAMHGNVFQADDLKKAQQNPEAYQNLQVRVCGWNAYFVNLSKEEQDAFIQQAESGC